MNLCVAQKVCLNCCHLADFGNCASCGEDQQKIFEGPTALQDFCSWLFNTNNAGALVMAHNAQGFDGQFILDHLEQQAVEPTIIANGRKIICLSSNGVKLIDSMSFLPMALKQFPGAFNLKELKKGHFPHYFNTAANWNYRGPIPDTDWCVFLQIVS